MNTKKMLELADAMEKLNPTKFNMSYFGKFNMSYFGNKPSQDHTVVCKEDLNVCGTTCCIAGYLLIDQGFCVACGGSVYSDTTRANYLGDAAGMAQEELELSNDQRSKLFYPWNWPYGYNTQDPKDAARLIRDMVAQETQ